MIPKFFGTIQFGKLTLENADAYELYLYTLNGPVEVTVRRKSNKRTLSQNQYYWAVVIRLIADETGHTSDEIHEMMKRMFLKDIITIKGEKYETVKSSCGLDTLEFSKDYIDRIRRWAQETIGVIIPDPERVE